MSFMSFSRWFSDPAQGRGNGDQSSHGTSQKVASKLLIISLIINSEYISPGIFGKGQHIKRNSFKKIKEQPP